jgi:glycosyltransferase involved in cell wall biosynthesis
MYHWQPYSRLFLKSDGVDWVLTAEMRALAKVCEWINIKAADLKYFPYAERQSVFFASRYELLQSDIWKTTTNRLATAYFHGRPGSGDPTFDELHKILCSAHPFIHRIQVSHGEMRDIVLSSGIDPSKVFLIPIGVDTTAFHLKTRESHNLARAKFEIPESAVVVGSFQKDGSGWGDGNEPKLIKGPDVFLSAIKILKDKIPGLFVFLTGPSRGYVINGLRELRIPFKHILFKNYTAVNDAYQALDLYVIASRQEGGPKAVLESMATGVPLVTTRVGQAMDLVQHKRNGWMVEVEDVEGLTHWSVIALGQNDLDKKKMMQSARLTAEENSYQAQIPLWKKFMEGFVE